MKADQSGFIPGSDIIFWVGGTEGYEGLRLCPRDGRILVRGKEVARDEEVVRAVADELRRLAGAL